MSESAHIALRPIIIYDAKAAAPVEDHCDCACQIAESPNLFSDRIVDEAGLFLFGSLKTWPVSIGYHVGLSERLPGAFILNDAALRSLQQYVKSSSFASTPQQLQDTQRHETLLPLRSQTRNAHLFMQDHDVPDGQSRRNALLSAWLHVTDRCNLRCDYCYLPHIQEDMSVATGMAAVQTTIRSALAHGYQGVKFKYGGGEPLLRLPLILQLHSHARALVERSFLELDGVLLSNGTLLTDASVRKIQRLGLRLMISLDGLGDVHDRQRVYADGRGTFEQVKRGIETALHLGLVPDISVTVTGRTAQGLPELMEWILAHNLPFSLNFYRETDFSASCADLRLQQDRVINGMLAAFRVIEANLPRRSILASVVDRSNLAAPHVRTCAVGHNYLVFDQRGRVSKCQMNIGRSVTTVDAEDPLSLVHSDKIGIQNLSVDEKEGCKSCEWKYWCTGGCPLATFRATGRYDVKSPNCEIYKALLPEALRLEGLRLLKYFGDTQNSGTGLEP